MKNVTNAKCGIYSIENTINGKFYIGSSININARKLLNSNTTLVGL